jgi:hypothetical protein
MLTRWKQALQACSSYLVVGDGDKRLDTEYFPAAVPIAPAEATALQAALQAVPARCHEA